MKINIHFFNVNHGDSIVIEAERGNESEYIVIDSNLIKKNNKRENPAYNFLRSKKVERISTLIITHLHFDHYSGVENLLDNFDIKKIVIPPFLSDKSEIFKSIIKRYLNKIKNVLHKTADDFIYSNADSLVSLIDYLEQNSAICEEGRGRESRLRFPGIDWLDGYIYLPNADIKGILHQKILSNDFDLDFFPAMNDASIAFNLIFDNFTILFSGDSTLKQWIEHKRKMSRDGIHNLDVLFLKAPHHGSKENNNLDLYKYLFDDLNGKTVFISANGKSHPHKELFQLINDHNLNPYCTNLSSHCIPPNVYDISHYQDIPKEFLQFLIHYDYEKGYTPCQGDITLTIENGNHSIKNNTGSPCVYR